MHLLVALLALGSIEGVVKLEGKRPDLPPLAITRDTSACGAQRADESVAVSAAGEIGNVVVSLRDAPDAVPAPAPGEVFLDQKGCAYAPHVLAAPVGARLVVGNSDPVLHNAHGYAGVRTAFNFAFPLVGLKRGTTLAAPGVMRLACDAGHRWMSGFIAVFAHRFFAVTDAQGRFRIEGVPAGRHVLELWHEPVGGKGEPVVQALSVRVRDGEVAKASAALRLGL